MTLKNKTFYITTPIYYVNDVPHIGHAYTTIACDTLARFKRFCGHDVYFLTGTDEHGQKVEQSAKENNETPKELADRVVNRYKQLWKRLNITNDDFIRTTESRHKEAVTKLFNKVNNNGDIYLGEYEGWYCTPCETFWTESQLKDEICPDCNRKTEKLKEKSYFFKMSKYQSRLLKHIEENPDFIKPESRKNEIISFIKGGLRDLSISRTTFDWGIRLPNDEKHIMYVWFDALANYISGLGYSKKSEKFEKYWPADVHVMGKDIVRFHAIYWPTFLMSAGIPLPKQIFGHGWWTIEGKKMSKSLQNIVEPNSLIDRFGTDAIRYFLLREVPFGSDGDFSHKAVISRINNDLANDLGNLLNRSLAMTKKYFKGVIPKNDKNDDFDLEFINSLDVIVTDTKKWITELSFHKALLKIWEFISNANKYVDKSAPWALAKDEAKLEKLETVIYNFLEALRVISVLIYPFMPEKAGRIVDQLGIPDHLTTGNWSDLTKWGRLEKGIQINIGEQLFPKILAKKDKDTKKMTETAEKIEVKDDLITIDQFANVDLRVAKVLEAEKVKKSRKLLKLKVQVGTEERQLVAGISLSYEPDQIIGKHVIIVANLKPAKLMGIESNGMVLAANNGETIVLAEFNGEVSSGTRVR